MGNRSKEGAKVKVKSTSSLQIRWINTKPFDWPLFSWPVCLSVSSYYIKLVMHTQEKKDLYLMTTLPPKTSLSSVSKYAIYLMSITRAVLAQSPEPEAHDKSALKNNNNHILRKSGYNVRVS